MLKVTLIVKFKSGEIKTINYDKVTDIYADYENNRFSLADFHTGLEYKYHFNPKGDESEQVATEILEINIQKEEN